MSMSWNLNIKKQNEWWKAMIIVSKLIWEKKLTNLLQHHWFDGLTLCGTFMVEWDGPIGRLNYVYYDDVELSLAKRNDFSDLTDLSWVELNWAEAWSWLGLFSQVNASGVLWLMEPPINARDKRHQRERRRRHN